MHTVCAVCSFGLHCMLKTAVKLLCRKQTKSLFKIRLGRAITYTAELQNMHLGAHTVTCTKAAFSATAIAVAHAPRDLYACRGSLSGNYLC